MISSGLDEYLFTGNLLLFVGALDYLFDFLDTFFERVLGILRFLLGELETFVVVVDSSAYRLGSQGGRGPFHAAEDQISDDSECFQRFSCSVQIKIHQNLIVMSVNFPITLCSHRKEDLNENFPHDSLEQHNIKVLPIKFGAICEGILFRRGIKKHNMCKDNEILPWSGPNDILAAHDLGQVRSIQEHEYQHSDYVKQMSSSSLIESPDERRNSEINQSIDIILNLESNKYNSHRQQRLNDPPVPDTIN
jgi:hypothetical protein